MRDYLIDIVYIGRYIDIRLIVLASVPKNGFSWTVVSRFIAMGQQCSDYFECFHWNSLISLKRHCHIQRFRCSGSNNTPAWLFYTDYRPCGVSGEPDRVVNRRGEFINITPLRHKAVQSALQEHRNISHLLYYHDFQGRILHFFSLRAATCMCWRFLCKEQYNNTHI